jgi:hypothetical protein
MKSFLMCHHKEKQTHNTLLYRKIYQKNESNSDLFEHIKSQNQSPSVYISDRAIINKMVLSMEILSNFLNLIIVFMRMLISSVQQI